MFFENNMKNIANKFVEGAKKAGKEIIKTGKNFGYGVLVGSMLSTAGCAVEKNWASNNDYEAKFDNTPLKNQKLDYKTIKMFHNKEYYPMHFDIPQNVLPVTLAPVRGNLEKGVDLNNGYQDIEIPKIIYIGIKAEDKQGGYYDRIETGIRARESARAGRINLIDEKDLEFDLPERIVLGGQEYFTFTRGPEKYVVPKEGTKAIIQHGTKQVIFENEDNIIKVIPIELSEAQRKQYEKTYFLGSNGLEQKQEGHVYKHEFNQQPPTENPLQNSNAVYHTVTKGDTFWGIADKNNLGKGGVNQIQSLNPNVNPKKLEIGQKIRIK